MSDLVDINDRLESATEKAENGAQIIHDVANGEADVYIQTESGPIPTLATVTKRINDEIGDSFQQYIDGSTSIFPAANKIPLADGNGLLDAGWYSGIFATEAALLDSKKYSASGAGAREIGIDAKLRLSSVSVEEYGALGGTTDDSAAFQRAVDALPAKGGTVRAAGPAYTIKTAPVVGTKSVLWEFGVNTEITGQTTFPRFSTNGSCAPVGPYIRSQRASDTIDGAAAFAFAVESIQPAGDTNNGYGAMYLGAQLNADGQYSINSALNAVATANAGSSGNVFGIEIDVATFAASGKGTQFGLLVSGAGGNDVTFGIRVNRHGTPEKYLYGLAIANSRIGMFVDDVNASLENGLLLGTPSTRYAGNMLQAIQIQNSGAVVLLERRTNTNPAGDFINCISAGNTEQLMNVDASGNLNAKRVQGSYFRAVGAPVAQAAGQMGIGAQTSASASAGTITPPAAVAGYLTMYIGSTQYKVPYYAA